MRSYYFIWGLVILFFQLQSCEPKLRQEAIPPKNLIDENKMIEILTEIHLADAASNKTGMSIDSRKKQRDIYFKAILDKYQVEAKTFHENYEYYVAQKIDTVLYQKVIDKLDQQVKNESVNRLKQANLPK